MTFSNAAQWAGIALLAVSINNAWADASPADLGTTLTPMGAQIAGNTDGSIPAYTGGLIQAPAGFDEKSGVRPDPFAHDKPLYRVDSKNMAQYAPLLSEGMKALLSKNPQMYLDVYPSRRSVAYPKDVLENSRLNATRARTTLGGIAVEGAIGGFPFPLPKDGNEVMWNHALAYSGVSREWNAQTWVVEPMSKPLLTMEQTMHSESVYYGEAKGDEAAKKYISLNMTSTTMPARSAGQKLLIYTAMNPVESGNLSWSYVPAQRRVRQLPDYVYDSPIGSAGGYMVVDDASLFSGAMDRFDFKLVGKKEMLIPYNNYDAVYGCTQEKLLTPGAENPQCMRWEKHRVWEVEANLKSGNRHIYSKRRFFWDEDSYLAGLTENYDASGKLFKVGYSLMAPAYEAAAPLADTTIFHDLSSGAYVVYSYAGRSGGYHFTAPWPAKALAPQAMAGTGVR